MIIDRWFKWVLPQQEWGSPANERRANVMAVLIGVEIVTTLGFTVLAPWISNGWYFPIGAVASSLGLGAAFALRAGRLNLAGQLIMTATAGAAFSGGVFTGGPRNPAFAWIFFVPLFAGLMLEVTAATVWSLLSGLVAIGALWAHLNNLLPASTYDPPQATQMVADLIAMTLVATVVMRLHLQATRVAQDRLGSALDDLRQEVIVRAQAEREAHDATTAQQTFLASVSHEIRTPLNGILGLTELLSRSTLSERQRAHVQALTKSSTTLRRLLSDLLDLSKLRSGGFTTVANALDPRGVISSVVQLHSAANPEVVVHTAYGPDLPNWVSGDETRLMQIVGNLTANAIHAATTQVQLTVSWADDTLDICIDDDGPGVPEEERFTIFQPFHQVPGTLGGTGLGLAVVAGLTAVMRGTVQFEDTPLGGARARITLTMPKVSAPAHAKRAADALSSSIRVLMVDDDAVNRLVIGGLLTSLEVTYTEATDGEEALRKLGQSDFDLVLMDLHMPGLDGLATTRQARERGVGIPFVCLTASAAASVEKEVAAAGMNGVLSKPVSRRDLAMTIQHHAVHTGTPVPQART